MNKIITFAACLTTMALLHAQNPIYVTPDGTGNGASWTNACELETATKTAMSGNQIWVQKGMYNPTKMLIITDSVKIYGGFTGTETELSQRNFTANPTVIDGQHKIGSIFRLEKAATIDGFTIQNGNANSNPYKNGGGIWADENSVIENCIIIHNTAALSGGGVYANGKVKIINSTVIDNTSHGSGINTFGNCLAIETNKNNVAPNTIAGCNEGTPDFGEVSFKTDKIWTISGNGVEQEWSDVVTASGCTKTAYYGGIVGNYYSDCRANSDRTKYGDLFSWCAVARFAHVLCPNGWRVPTNKDFFDLDVAFGGYGDGSGPGVAGNESPYPGKYYTYLPIYNSYVNVWGCSGGGICWGSGALEFTTCSVFWTLSEYNATWGFYTHYNPGGTVRPQGWTNKEEGHTLRCIR